MQTLLAVYNWPPTHPRYKKIEKFVDAFFSKFPEFLKPPRHPNWKTVNLAATIPGWNRFPAAQKWLDQNANRKTASEPSDNKIRTAFETFLNEYSDAGRAGALNPDRREQLYSEFTDWWKKRVKGSQ